MMIQLILCFHIRLLQVHFTQNVSLKNLVKSKSFSTDQIRSSNLFNNPLFDNSDNNVFKPMNNQVFKKVKMVWRVKGSSPEKDVSKSYVPKPKVKKNNVFHGKSFVKPDIVYSINHLLMLAQKKIYCSYCGTNEFVNKNYVQYWYGTCKVSSNGTAPNKPRPKFRWVPKLLNLFYRSIMCSA